MYFFCLISIVTFSVTFSVTVSVSVSRLLFRVRVDLFNFSLEYLWMWRQYRNTSYIQRILNLIEFGPDPEGKRPKIYSRKVRNDFVLLKTRKSSVHAYCFRNTNWFQKTKKTKNKKYPSNTDSFFRVECWRHITGNVYIMMTFIESSSWILCQV